VAALKRIFGATIFFGTDSQLDRAAVFQQVRFNFMSEARLWYWRSDGDQRVVPEVGENVVVLSPEFYQEIITHPIPTDLQAARALSGSPAALDLYNWLSYRCHIAKREERVRLFGAFGLTAQLGMAEYSRPRKFQERLEQWLRLVSLMWPECPAYIGSDGRSLVIHPGTAILSRAPEAISLRQQFQGRLAINNSSEGVSILEKKRGVWSRGDPCEPGAASKTSTRPVLSDSRIASN
jgi:hypothetical protein